MEAEVIIHNIYTIALALTAVIGTVGTVITIIAKFRGDKKLEAVGTELQELAAESKAKEDTWRKTEASVVHFVKTLEKIKKQDGTMGVLKVLEKIKEDGEKLNFGLDKDGNPVTMETVVNEIVKKYTE